jgi:triacylglycerol esterase/lipase EstA (alpha/beta hydrolase family)
VYYQTAQATSPTQSALVSAVPAYTISGTVTTSDGTGVSGITVDQQMNIRTDANGHYSVRVAAGASYTVAPNDLSGTYWFSPRNATFTNVNSNQSANFTATPVTYVYLIHGIGQTAAAMAGLKANLEDLSVGVDPARYHIDAGFTFGCATTCGGACSVQPGQTLVNLGAQWLGSYIQIQQPPGNIILVGYSMGGLIARDLVANNYGGALTGHPVTALITLGTPNLGCPAPGDRPHQVGTS